MSGLKPRLKPGQVWQASSGTVRFIIHIDPDRQRLDYRRGVLTGTEWTISINAFWRWIIKNQAEWMDP